VLGNQNHGDHSLYHGKVAAEQGSVIHKAVAVALNRALAGRSYRFPPTSFLPSLQERKHLTHPAHTPQQPNQHFILNQADSSLPRSTRTFSNPTSSAPETALVCQSRISKLSTRSRKRMKIPARSSRVNRTTFTFVSNVRLPLPLPKPLYPSLALFVALHMQTSHTHRHPCLHTCTRSALHTTAVHRFANFRTERNGRKTLTTVQGLPKKFDQKKILKVIKKKFACNGTIVTDAEMGEVVQLQGDQRKDVQDFLTDKKEGLGLDAKTIKVSQQLNMRRIENGGLTRYYRSTVSKRLCDPRRVFGSTAASTAVPVWRGSFREAWFLDRWPLAAVKKIQRDKRGDGEWIREVLACMRARLWIDGIPHESRSRCSSKSRYETCLF
jgi:translation initiation factor SUI1